jgi:S1-C subfamily serine protease
MVVLSALLAMIVAFVATIIYAQVDSRRPITIQPSRAQPVAPVLTRPTIAEDRPTTTKVPENLSPDELAKKVAASVRGVRTLDDAGVAVEGSAFVVGSFGGQTLLLTSFAVVRASTLVPAPPITLDGGQQATLWTWQEDRDLALLVVGGSIESLPWVSVPVKPGDPIYAGGAGQRPTAGVVIGLSDAGIEHNVFVDDVRQGAPLVNQKGEVVGMASRAYNPNGKGTDTVFIAIPIRVACERMLRCGTGNTGPGESSSTTVTTKP